LKGRVQNSLEEMYTPRINL